MCKDVVYICQFVGIEGVIYVNSSHMCFCKTASVLHALYEIDGSWSVHNMNTGRCTIGLEALLKVLAYVLLYQ